MSKKIILELQNEEEFEISFQAIKSLRLTQVQPIIEIQDGEIQSTDPQLLNYDFYMQLLPSANMLPYNGKRTLFDRLTKHNDIRYIILCDGDKQTIYKIDYKYESESSYAANLKQSSQIDESGVLTIMTATHNRTDAMNSFGANI